MVCTIKTSLLALALGAFTFLEAPLLAQDNTDNSDESASFQTFYDSLGNQGTWIQSDDYGYVWMPQVNDPDWAPYTDGHWVYSDDGWTWITDESWGWATYHYGRWVNLDGIGWCWVPGYTWAPAWVSWRYGDGYCGWAPLPPDSFVGIDYFGDGFDIGIGFHIGGDCDGYYGIGAGWYHFVPVGCLGYSNYRRYYAHRYDNFAIINRTTNVTNINVTRGGNHAASGANFHHVTTGGPSFSQVNAVSQTPVPQVNLVSSHQPGGGRLTNHSLALFAPRVDPGTSHQSRPGSVTQAVDHPVVNRGTDITRPLAVNPHLTPESPTTEEIQKAQQAQSNAPQRAKIATANTQVNPILNAPLTSLKPTATFSAPSANTSTTISNSARPSFNSEAPPSRTMAPSYSGQGSGAPPVYHYHPASPPSSPPASGPYSPPAGPGHYQSLPGGGNAPYHSGNNSGGGSGNSGGGSHGGGGASGNKDNGQQKR